MTRVRHFVAAVLFVAGCSRADSLQAQMAPAKWADTVSLEIENANMSGDPARLQAARALAERVATAYPSDGLMLHYAGFANYREASIQMARGGAASAGLQRAKDFLERSLKLRKLPETQALLAAVNGQMIALDQSRAMELGMESQALTMASLSSGPNNPRVWLLHGIGTFHTPPEYGGGTDEAIEQLEHAVELFAKDAPKPGEPSWGRAEVHVWLGQAYEKKGAKAKAAAEYRAAVDLAPSFMWAKSLLAASK